MMYPCEFNKNSLTVSQDRVQTNRSWSKFDILMSPVILEIRSMTLEIRSKAPKSNPSISLFQWCIHMSMIRIRLLAHGIGCIQALLVQI